MNEFLQNLQVKEKMINGKPESKYNQELDVYRKLVEESIHGFLIFMDAVNDAINTLEDNMIMSSVQFKTRIKDAMGTVNNSDKKPLDDIFGFELIARNERNKEILMLLIHKIYDKKICYRINNHNKSNGYIAHHRVGVIKSEFSGDEFKDIESYILSAKTKRLKKEYRDLNRNTLLQMTIKERENLYEEIYLFPELRQQIIKEGQLDKDTINAILEAANVLIDRLQKAKSIEIPVVEVQFKTSSVAEEAIFGTASHVNYKLVNEDEVISDFKNHYLIRGMNYPFKFFRTNNEMKLQTSDTTLLEMYPFLKDLIKEFKHSNQAPITTYDMHFATIFPELKEYVEEVSKVEPYYSTANSNKESLWTILKLRALNPKLAYSTIQTQNIKKEGEEK